MTLNKEGLEAALLPCPFCGASGDELMMFCDPIEGRNNSGPSRRIQCACCNIETPFYDTKAEAIAGWNRRQSPAGVEVGGWIDGDLRLRVNDRSLLARILSCLSVKEPEGVEPVWFAVQSASGAHVGMWQEERIARRVFEHEHPDGKFIPLHASPQPNPVTISDDVLIAIGTLFGNYIPGHGWTGFGPTPDQITAALSATRTAVKPLEWKGPGDEDVSYGDQGGFVYTVRPPNRTPGWRVWVTLKSFDGITASIGGLIVTVKAESREAAFAAAQADFERRILSAIVGSAK